MDPVKLERCFSITSAAIAKAQAITRSKGLDDLPSKLCIEYGKVLSTQVEVRSVLGVVT